MVYSSTANTHSITGGDRYDNANSGVTTAIQATAFVMVKAKVKARGLTPPAADDTLGAAEDMYAIALSYNKGRMIGDLPSGGANSSIATYDNVNKSVILYMGLGDGLIEDYIANINTTNILAADVDGQTRGDEISDNMKLNQGDLPTFAEI